MSLVKSTATIGIFTILSRILGFVRDIAIASNMGAGMLSDAFFVAFRIPNYLRRLFAEGAFNAAFIPMYSGMLAEDGKDRARHFSSEAMAYLVFLLLIVVGVFILAMPWILHLLAPGFSDNSEKFALTITLTRITMPYILFISLVSLLGGILNSVQRFAAAAATPVIMNLCLIIIPFALKSDTPTMAHAFSIAVTVSGVMQWLWLVWFCKKEGMLPRMRYPRLTKDVKRLMIIIAPVALGAGVAQINLFVDTIIATHFDSGVSYLYYADRINELPLAVIGIALGTALLPMLSRLLREGKTQEANNYHNRAIEIGLFLSLPAAAALILIAEPIIHVMFERGAFLASDTQATYRALQAFACGLPAFVLAKILSPGFYAKQDTKTPFKIALLCMAVNLILNLLLMEPLRHVGMAVATAIAGWVNVICMLYVLMKRRWFIAQASVALQTGKLMLSCCVMLLALHLTQPFTDPYMYDDESTRFTALIALVMSGLVAYFTAAFTVDALGCRKTLLNRLKHHK